MKKYIGTKEINAIPMNRQEYNDFRGWKLPDDEDGTDEGYLVEYVDGGKANTPQYAGYVSWSPKAVFERAYKSIETPLDRMYIEYNELLDKLNKLTVFLGREDKEKIAGGFQCELMELQRAHMKGYLLVLRSRIELMKK
ncbi:hypothetical protein NXX39_20780 [Bacteroides ovatus]|jgi:hypothetical protein|uniref:crAss001_48 related protein n=1 Tax=Bacteroides ovatus TaxID=28116 RepID=UPI001CCF9DFE|nr:hypothetical protein [Bacteroides ovatus]DAU74122.1 MAG TPA: hypothetical protein [Crassvirales sp.]MCS2475515.1 hypothetical protein [Bacteroides ovatus]MCS3099760.1 hypothetical protein [Bacteroides ovatus]MDC2623604.1 hypothetical protein [Bacteroides ovatus]MDC2637559.1 hypothetical protein [Bacteroides ovatus]